MLCAASPFLFRNLSEKGTITIELQRVLKRFTERILSCDCLMCYVQIMALAVIIVVKAFIAAGCGAGTLEDAKRTTPPAAATNGVPVIPLRQLVGAPARVVWVQDRGEGDDMHQSGRNHALMAFDTESGRTRELYAPGDQINRPLLSPDGRYIVFSRRREDAVYRLPWTGGTPVRISTGFALALWRDPKTGRDWVYLGRDRSKNEDAPYRRIVRHPIDDPSRVEEIWSGSDVSLDSVHVSRDGLKIGGLFPWPHGAIIDAPSRKATHIGRGCWTSLAPDNSYILWIFDGTHRNLFLYSPDGRHRHRIPINTVPGGQGRKMYHPRWSNHARFLVVSGPYPAERGRLRVAGAAGRVDVWVGRFNERFDAVEAWARVTDNQVGDYTPDLWVAGGATSEVGAVFASAPTAPLEMPALTARWPGTDEGLLFAWSHANTRNEARGSDGTLIACEVEPHGWARWSPSYGMDIRRGHFLARDAGPRISEACRRANQFSLELTLLARAPSLRGPARIVTLSRRIGDSNFLLGQEGDSLVIRIRTPETGPAGTAHESQTEIAPVETNVRRHVVIAYRNGELACYVDGEAVPVQQRIRGTLENWDDRAELRFGDEASGDRTWDGELDGVAVFNRFIGPEEAKIRCKLSRERFTRRPAPEVITVRARLVAASATPSPADIAPYRRALALCEYELEPSEPAIDGSRRIQVYHWVIMDGKVVPDAIPAGGEVVSLRLERTDDHPQLEAERRLVGIDAFDLPEFIDVSR